MGSFTEEEIRPAELMQRKKSALEADRLFLLERKDQWKEVSCPVCSENFQTNFGEKQGCHFVRCPACSMVYMSPRPSRELLQAYYEQSQNYAFWSKYIFPATELTRYEKIHKPRAESLVKQCADLGVTGGSFLEIGAAYGSFCRAVQETGFFRTVTALEPTSDLADRCRQSGLHVIESTIENYQSEEKFDVIAAYEVIEHIYDPSFFLRCCYELLKPSGLILLSFPNVEGFDIRILGTDASCFQYGHLNYFSQSSISYLLFKLGFSVLILNTPGELDTDMVRKRISSKELDINKYAFLKYLLAEENKEVACAFQEFIKQLKISSHMTVVASKGHSL